MRDIKDMLDAYRKILSEDKPRMREAVGEKDGVKLSLLLNYYADGRERYQISLWVGTIDDNEYFGIDAEAANARFNALVERYGLKETTPWQDDEDMIRRKRGKKKQGELDSTGDFG